jgi:N-acetyl-anhydromuramyl-L-alanine amidase AmpD
MGWGVDVDRYTPKVGTTILSPNKSSREGVHPTLIVIHATVSHNLRGLGDLKSIGEYFAKLSTEASSHVCTDNEGHSARYVWDRDKAWHCAGFNRMSLGIEQILPADGSELTRDLYRETARWVARWSKMYGIPIHKGKVSGAEVIRTGVVRHSELGVIGGGHTDPGKYDMAAMLALARFYRSKI